MPSRCKKGTRRNKTGACESHSKTMKAMPKSLSKQTKTWVRIQIAREYRGHDRMQRALESVSQIKYDPEYESKFDGKKFTGKDKAKKQAMDKVDAFFKYGDSLE